MVLTTTASEVTTVIRDVGAWVEIQGRALSSSVRHLILAAEGGEPPRAFVIVDRSLTRC